MIERPDEKLEAFHLWTQVPATRRRRIDWISTVIWGGAAVFCFAFWAAVAWVIWSTVMAW